MSLTIHLRSTDQEVNLGPALQALQSFKEIAKAAPGTEAFGLLFSLPDRQTKELSDEEAKILAEEARVFSQLYGDKLGDHAYWMLQTLSKLISSAPDR